MAQRLMRALQRTSKSSNLLLRQQPKIKPTMNIIINNNVNNCCNFTSRRNYIAEMRKDAFEGYILRLLRNEIRYELERSPPIQPAPEFKSFKVEERPGEQWIRLTRKYKENEEIKVEVTMFDASIPAKKPGGVTTDDDVQLHITLVVDISKGESNDMLEFVCSAWLDSIEIRKVYTRKHDRELDEPYMGPGFKELDDELQNSLYDFLEARGINDDLATFLHQYMKNKDKTEYVRWIERVKSCIEKK